jgi:hypothetical protein
VLLEQNHKQKEMERKPWKKRILHLQWYPRQASTEEPVQRHWQGVVKRRSFLKGLGIAGRNAVGGRLIGH